MTRVQTIGVVRLSLVVVLGWLIALVGMEITHSGNKAQSNAWGKTTEGFRLSARADRQARSNQPILLRVSIKNVTRRILYLIETSPEKEYDIYVRNSRGQKVKPTELGQRLLNNKGVDYRVIGIKVMPGETRDDAIDVAKLWDMSVPDRYDIRVARRIKKIEREGWTEVTSNTVQVRITN